GVSNSAGYLAAADALPLPVTFPNLTWNADGGMPADPWQAWFPAWNREKAEGSNADLNDEEDDEDQAGGAEDDEDNTEPENRRRRGLNAYRGEVLPLPGEYWGDGGLSATRTATAAQLLRAAGPPHEACSITRGVGRCLFKRAGAGFL